MDYRKVFAVEPGAKVRLSKIDASYAGKHETHEEALPEIQNHVERMDKLQYLLYADGGLRAARVREMFSLKSIQMVQGSVCIGLRASCRVCARPAKWRA
jgi:hypothetical protein